MTQIGEGSFEPKSPLNIISVFTQANDFNTFLCTYWKEYRLWRIYCGSQKVVQKKYPSSSYSYIFAIKWLNCIKSELKVDSSKDCLTALNFRDSPWLFHVFTETQIFALMRNFCALPVMRVFDTLYVNYCKTIKELSIVLKIQHKWNNPLDNIQFKFYATR